MDANNLDTNIIDPEIFEQILMCDDDSTRSFSKDIVVKYLKQVDETLPVLKKFFAEKNLQELSKKGHFLKSSSAVLGLKKVKNQCEFIQHYGNKKDIAHSKDLTQDEAIVLLTSTLTQLETAYSEAKTYLIRFYKLQPHEL